MIGRTLPRKLAHRHLQRGRCGADTGHLERPPFASRDVREGIKKRNRSKGGSVLFWGCAPWQRKAPRQAGLVNSDYAQQPYLSGRPSSTDGLQSSALENFERSALAVANRGAGTLWRQVGQPSEASYRAWLRRTATVELE